MTVTVITSQEVDVTGSIAAAEAAKAARITEGWTPASPIYVVAGNNSWVQFFIKEYTPPA